MTEKESDFIPKQNDLTNEDVIRRILESGTAEELEQMRVFHNLMSEQLKLFGDYAKLRKKTHEQMDQELKERVKKNPSAAQEELDMGCYKESIEPQVRETVLKLRRKGYATYESGFNGFNSQKISFEENHLDDVQFPDELTCEFKNMGVDIKIKPNTLLLTCNRYFQLDELERFWNQIENILPSLPQQPAEPCSLPAAKSFRERHK